MLFLDIVVTFMFLLLSVRMYLVLIKKLCKWPLKLQVLGVIFQNITSNQDFLQHEFYQADGTPFSIANESIIEKFQSITGIVERKYAKSPQHNDLATLRPCGNR